MKLKYSPSRRLGNKAEDLACIFLNNLQHNILNRNYLKKVGEIDIITSKDNVLHFIEVKSVTQETPFDVIHETNNFFRPEHKLNKGKILKMYKTANMYLLDHHLSDIEAQFDLVTVTFYKSGDVPRIDYVENIT